MIDLSSKIKVKNSWKPFLNSSVREGIKDGGNLMLAPTQHQSGQTSR